MPLLVVFIITGSWAFWSMHRSLSRRGGMRAQKIVNRKSATALGVTVAPSVLLQAGEVIE